MIFAFNQNNEKIGAKSHTLFVLESVQDYFLSTPFGAQKQTWAKICLRKL